jgi:hypothetical protein
MTPRVLWLASLAVALLVSFDQAAARPRRFFPRTSNSVPGTSEALLQQVTYPVADVVGSIPSGSGLEVAPLPQRLDVDSKSKPVNRQTEQEPLVNHLVANVAPLSWQAAGGQGTIQYLPSNKALIVNQTPAVHGEIAKALADLRGRQTSEIAVICQVMKIPVKDFQKVRAELDVVWLDETKLEKKRIAEWIVTPTGTSSVAFLNDDQLDRFCDTVSADPSGGILQSQVTIAHNGQNARLEATQHQFFLTGVGTNTFQGQTYLTPDNHPIANGLRLAMRPDVSADKRFVRLNINGFWSQPAGPVQLIPVQLPVPQALEGPGNATTTLTQSVIFQMFLQQPTFAQIRFNGQVNVPDGGTVLIDGGIVPCEVKRQNWFWESWIALVTGDDVETSTWEDHHVVLLVTPRIVGPQGDEKNMRISSTKER